MEWAVGPTSQTAEKNGFGRPDRFTAHRTRQGRHSRQNHSVAITSLKNQTLIHHRREVKSKVRTAGAILKLF